MELPQLILCLARDITAIENDFNKVNDILFQITNELQERLGRVSPLMFLLDWAGQNKDEKVIDFSMRKARDQSWNSANLLWSIGDDQQNGTINTIDQVVLKNCRKDSFSSHPNCPFYSQDNEIF